jgi:hypothetical protein
VRKLTELAEDLDRFALAQEAMIAELADKAANILLGCPVQQEPQRSRTPLGRRLRGIRQKIRASGAELLDWDGIDQQLRGDG